MLCEKCSKKKATVFYNENVNGKTRSFHLCADCAQAMKDSGELEDLGAAFQSFLSPFSMPEESFFNDLFALPFHPASGLTAPKKCPLCGATLRDISGAGRVGCASCYDTFASELEEPIRASHGKTEHVGRIARGHRAKREKANRLAELKKQLKEAVSKENYEEAAALRDQIRGLEAGA